MHAKAVERHWNLFLLGCAYSLPGNDVHGLPTEKSVEEKYLITIIITVSSD